VTSAQSAMPDMLPLRDMDPREVGAYRLLGRLGEGGQAVVFLAVGADGSRVAVKLLPPTTNPQVRNRFLKEVAAAQRLARFCTAQVVDAGIFERRPFIVSEYVSGPSLVEVVERFGPRSDVVLQRIAVATLTALGAAHAVGMVHRDVKPGNVLLGPEGPVVIDFGLAAVPGMTTTGMSGQVAIGTPAYMAPEQLAGRRVTAAADMWSWAVMMAYAGTGELPFRGDSLTAAAYAILHSEPGVGRLPEPLGSLVRRCLNKDPAARPSARAALSEFAAAGARLVAPMPSEPQASDSDDGAALISSDGLISGGPASRSQRGRHGSGRASSRRRTAALAASILLVAGAAGLAFALFPRHALSERSASLEQSAGSHPQTSQLTVEAAVRAEAVSWVIHQVSQAWVVSCDAQVCTDLASAGFASSSLYVLGSSSNDPLDSQVVVATAAVRSQFGSRLSVYAPAVLASFGTGNAKIDILWVYPDGAAAYKTALSATLSLRKGAGAQLLSNSKIRFSPQARTALLSGQVDPRLLQLIAGLAGDGHPLYVVDFASQSPGGGRASLMRWVDLATSVQAAHLTPAAYTSWVRSYLTVQRAEYHPDWDPLVRLHGQTVLRIGYSAPSQLSLLG
jgi:serine/threonine protein kinase